MGCYRKDQIKQVTKESPEETQSISIEHECPPLIVVPQWGDEGRALYNGVMRGVLGYRGLGEHRSVEGWWGVSPLPIALVKPAELPATDLGPQGHEQTHGHPAGLATLDSVGR